MPQGCASNIARCVQVKEGKISGYKSYDAHIIMQNLLPSAIRKTLPKHVALPLMRLSGYFRGICKRVINPKDLDRLQAGIVENLCEQERKFPPSFFDIMIHLPIHLVDEIKRGGSVCDWWMYLNASVNKQSKWFNKCQEKTDEIDEESPLFPKVGYPIGRKKKGKKKGKAYTLDLDTMALAHRYVEHEEFVKKKYRDKRKRRWKEAQEHSNEFMVWFREKVVVDNVPDHIKWLSKGPSTIARRYTGYFCNGYKFYTRDHDERCKTQNSGVSLTALTPSFTSSKDHNPVLGNVTYYGAIKSMIEVDYWSTFSVVLFECDWFHVEVDDYGLTRNFKKFCSKDDPFVLASQVHQVFYTQDGLE
uniref:DUF4218 domain-containing protein n=1 Tax=Chenopodium quinoa TaxID=63459 RepID=A0A803MT40_CHEQI